MLPECAVRALQRGLAATVVAVTTGASSLAAKGKGKGQGATGTPGKNKVGLCHLDDETNLYTYIEVPPPAMKGHQKHDDVLAPNGATACDGLNKPEPEPEA